jgi:hypothetical protein
MCPMSPMCRVRRLLSSGAPGLIAALVCVSLAFSFSTVALAQPTISSDSRAALQRTGANALNTEKRRERQNPCAGTFTETEAAACIAREYGLTQENYAAFAHSISGLLRLKFKDDTGGTILDVARGFETAEALWQRVRDLQCAAAGDQAAGDHSATDRQCQLYLTRRHIYDLQALYPDLWTK